MIQTYTKTSSSELSLGVVGWVVSRQAGVAVAQIIDVCVCGSVFLRVDEGTDFSQQSDEN